MNAQSELRNRLEPLMVALIEGAISDEQTLALRDILRDEPLARRYYAHYMFVHASLAWKETEPITEQAVLGHVDLLDQENAPSQPHMAMPSAPSPRSRSWLQWASRHPKGPSIAVAVAVMVAVVLAAAVTPVGQWIAGDGGGNKKDVKPATKSKHVAILNNWHNAVWLEGSRPPLKDPRLVVGRRLLLASGLIEIKYKTGARVVIEGPAEFTVGGQESGVRDHESGNSSRWRKPMVRDKDANSGYLAFGKLVARVEGKKAQGFFVDTPSARVEDLGTEFGVYVDSGGATESHVFKGAVRLDVLDSAGRQLSTMRLEENQAARVGGTGRRITTVPIRRDFYAQGIAVVADELRGQFGVVMLADPSDIRNQGKLIEANNIGPAEKIPDSITVNGVTFGNDQTSINTRHGFDFDVTMLEPLDELMKTGSYHRKSKGDESLNLSVGGLTIGNRYRLQILVVGNNGPRDMMFAGEGEDAIENVAVPSSKTEARNVLYEFTAKDNTLNVAMTCSNNAPYLQAYAVHEIAAPDSAATTEHKSDVEP